MRTAKEIENEIREYFDNEYSQNGKEECGNVPEIGASQAESSRKGKERGGNLPKLGNNCAESSQNQEKHSISFLDWAMSDTRASQKCDRMQCMRNYKGECKRKICDNPKNKERYGYKSK